MQNTVTLAPSIKEKITAANHKYQNGSLGPPAAGQASGPYPAYDFG